MKKTIKICGIIIVMISLLLVPSCNKEQEYIIKPNQKGMLKSTLIVDGTSIQLAIDTAIAGDVIHVMPGTYNEQIILKDGVNLYLEDGVIIDNNSIVAGPTITINSTLPVTCEILGFGIIKRSGTPPSDYRNNVVRIHSIGSDIKIYYKTIESALNTTTRFTVDISDSKVYLEGNLITGKGGGIYTRDEAQVIWRGGSIYSETDYGILASSRGPWDEPSDSYPYFGFDGIGNVMSDGNSAVECSGDIYSKMKYSGYAKSNGMFGFEQSSGTAYLYNATFESTVDNIEEGSAISKYSGDTLKLSNVTLLSAHPDAYSIETQGSSIPYNSIIYVLDSCYANRKIQTDPPMDIREGGDKLFSYPVGIPVTNLTAVKNLKGKIKTITLNWESDADNYDIWKDGVYLSNTINETYVDTVPGKFKQATYSVYNNVMIETLNRIGTSITVVK